GGSNAIYAQESVLLVESCEFEGKSGRGSSGHGRAMDLRGSCRVYVRGCQFTDNEELFRSASGVLDGCKIATDSPFWMPQGNDLFERGTQCIRKPAGGAPRSTFTEALDDLTPLTRLAGGAGVKAWTDATARAEAAALRLDKDREFWVR